MSMTTSSSQGHQLKLPVIGRGNADSIAFSPDHQFMAVGRKRVEIWDMRHLKAGERYPSPLYRLGELATPIKAMRFVDANTLETIAEDGTFRWNLCTGEKIQ
ncbi:MAG: WD40 repeat domain-containing protein [Aggregatilineales bacterium]